LLVFSKKTVITPPTFQNAEDQDTQSNNFHGRETWFLTLFEEHKLQVSESKRAQENVWTQEG